MDYIDEVEIKKNYMRTESQIPKLPPLRSTSLVMHNQGWEKDQQKYETILNENLTKRGQDLKADPNQIVPGNHIME